MVVFEQTIGAFLTGLKIKIKQLQLRQLKTAIDRDDRPNLISLLLENRKGKVSIKDSIHLCSLLDIKAEVIPWII